MASPAVIKIVDILRQMDALLSGDGIEVQALAESMNVDAKTIRRYLDHLRWLGQKPESIKDPDGKYRWRYRPECGPLFTAHMIPKRAQKVDHAAVIADIRRGMVFDDLVQKHQCSRGPIYDIASRNGLSITRKVRDSATNQTSKYKILAALINTDRTLCRDGQGGRPKTHD